MQLSSDPAAQTVQLQTIKQYVIDNHASVFDQNTANAMNVTASPDFFVFKSSVPTDDLNAAIDWAEILSGTPVSAIERWGYDVITKNGTINPTLTNIRDGLAEIFGGQTNTRTAILTLSTRLAKTGESILSADGTGGPAGGDGSAATASAMLGDGAEGDITTANLIEADGVV